MKPRNWPSIAMVALALSCGGADAGVGGDAAAIGDVAADGVDAPAVAISDAAGQADVPSSVDTGAVAGAGVGDAAMGGAAGAGGTSGGGAGGSPDAGGTAGAAGAAGSSGSSDAGADMGLPASGGPAAKTGASWLLVNGSVENVGGCSCDLKAGGWTCAASFLPAWYVNLEAMCAGKKEQDSCSGAVAAVNGLPGFRGFRVQAGRCISAPSKDGEPGSPTVLRCCPGCFDGKHCRMSLTQWQVLGTKHKAFDYTWADSVWDWHYWCGVDGERCKEGKGDQNGQVACKGVTGAPRPGSDACPDKITF